MSKERLDEVIVKALSLLLWVISGVIIGLVIGLVFREVWSP